MKDLAKNLPHTPGVYKMMDRGKHIIYVGKAKDLQKRVKTYFQKGYEHSTRTRKLLENTTNIDFIETDSELEALLLENNLIKELRPKYNILMKDDKSYVYIKVDSAEDFPRIRAVRERTLEKTEGLGQKVAPLGRINGLASLRLGLKARYFGPKLASSKVYETLRILKKLFPFRHCNLDIQWKNPISSNKSPRLGSCGFPSRGDQREGGRVRAERGELVGETAGFPQNKNLVDVTNRVIDYPCLDYYIKRCPGPCIGAISPVEYKKIVQQIMNFLEGKNDELEKSLKQQMADAASQKLFEKAARLRDKLFALQSITERQKITDHDRQDTDIINFSADLGRIFFNILMIRGGKLVSQENFALDALEMKEIDAPIDLVEVLQSFLLQYYERAADIPKEIFVPEELEDYATLEKWLTQKRGDRVTLLHPQKGEKNKLLELSHKNAVSFGKQFRIRWLSEQRGQTALARLAEVLSARPRAEREDLSEEARASRRLATERKSELIKRIEGYDISHLGGNETVGSMVVFENGLPKSSDYRHFKMRTVSGKPDDYRSMEETLMRRLKYLSKTENFRLAKPNKKIFEKIKNKNDLDPAEFFCFMKDKNLAGFVQLRPISTYAAEIGNLWIDEKYRGQKLGYELMKRAMQKSKMKKFYVSIRPALENYYAEFGFKHIKKVPNDLRMMMEKKALSYGDPSFEEKPNLLVIDGGKGQLNTALLALKRLKLEIPVIALAKRLEEIYLPGEKAPLLLEEGDEALKLLQRIRDESHRFAITFQRDLHRMKLLYA